MHLAKAAAIETGGPLRRLAFGSLGTSQTRINAEFLARFIVSVADVNLVEAARNERGDVLAVKVCVWRQFESGDELIHIGAERRIGGLHPARLVSNNEETSGTQYLFFDIGGDLFRLVDFDFV